MNIKTTRRMTYRELAKWVAQGNGEVLHLDGIHTSAIYSVGKENTVVWDGIKIRSWNETEWHEPLIEVKE